MKYIFTLLLLFILFHSNSQDKKFTQNVFTATLLEPGVSYEGSLSNRLTAKMRVAFSGRTVDTYADNGIRKTFIPILFTSGSVRHYYNFQKRIKDGKNTNRNSANYIGFLGVYGVGSRTDNIASSKTTIKLYNAGFVWGLQRNYKNRLSLDFNIGPGVLNTLLWGDVSIIGELSLGIWLGKKTD